MRIAVIGAGIAGVTTAWELSADGHEVTVFERRGSIAAEASFAEGGLLAPGYFALRQIWRELEGPRGRLGRLGRLPGLGRWLQRSPSPAERAHHESRLRALLQLGTHSRHRLHALIDTLGLEPAPAAGLLALLHDEDEGACAELALRQLDALGVEATLADEAACRRLEPGLNADLPIPAALHLPHDEVGNCRQVAQALRVAAQATGVRFALHRAVLGLEAGSCWRVNHQAVSEHPASAMSAFGPATQVADDDPPAERYDAVVVCAGAEAASLVQPLGLRWPVVARHGHSVTAPLREPELHSLGPHTAVAETGSWITISRVGQRVRAATPLDRGAPPRDPNPRLEPLYRLLLDRFPGAARIAQAQAWTGHCIAAPDGLPLIGATALPGLWLNAAQGDLGWTLACGAARLLADSLAGRVPSLDPQPFDPRRPGR
jgi:D-amino-acid dehydrogenase